LLADRSNSGGIPLLFNYEIGDPVPMSNVDAVVVATDDAGFALDARDMGGVLQPFQQREWKLGHVTARPE